jgi:hypothetical protein
MWGVAIARAMGVAIYYPIGKTQRMLPIMRSFHSVMKTNGIAFSM